MKEAARLAERLFFKSEHGAARILTFGLDYETIDLYIG